jgi:hypothetical protein
MEHGTTVMPDNAGPTGRRAIRVLIAIVSAVAVVTLAFAVALMIRHTNAAAPPSRIAVRDASKVAATTTTVLSSTTTTLDPTLAATTAGCSLNATVTTPASNPSQADRIAHFPPALVPDDTVQPMSRDLAVQRAQSEVGRGGTVDPSVDRLNAITTATEMSYQALMKKIQANALPDPIIAADRCVWLVTVHAPYSVKTPPGFPPRTDSVYNVILDVGSGNAIGLISGPDLSQ